MPFRATRTATTPSQRIQPLRLRACAPFRVFFSQALPYECQASFAPIMAQQMTFFSSDEGADVMQRVRGASSRLSSVAVRTE